MEASGVRNSWLTEPIRASRNRFGLRAHLRLIERVGDVEALERVGGIRQHVVGLLMHLGSLVRR